MDLLTTRKFRQVAGELAALIDLTGKPPAEVRFLDYGFGYGRFARVARALGADVFATELSPSKREYAASIGVKPISDDEAAQMTFDIVHTEQVFEHVLDPRGLARMLAATLAPNGLFKIAVPRLGPLEAMIKKFGMIDFSPYETGFSSGVFNAYNAVFPIEHLNGFTARSLAFLASDNGLSVEATVRPNADPILRIQEHLRPEVDRLQYVRKGLPAETTTGYILMRKPTLAA